MPDEKESRDAKLLETLAAAQRRFEELGRRLEAATEAAGLTRLESLAASLAASAAGIQRYVERLERMTRSAQQQNEPDTEETPNGDV